MKKIATFAALAIIGVGATSLSTISHWNRSKATIVMSVAEAASPTVSLGKKVAPLALVDVNGKTVTLGDWDKSKATVLMFVATKCPVSNAYNARMAALDKAYASKGVRFVGINSNKAEPGSEVASHSKEHGFGFVVYKDPANKIADQFEAKVTPEVYVVGPKGDLLYKGRIDNSQNEAEVKDKSLEVALNSILAGKPVAEKETRAFGCSIKRAG